MMKEKRKFYVWQVVLLPMILLSTVILWHVLNALEPHPQLYSFTQSYVAHLQPYNYSHPLHLLASDDYNSLVNYTFEFDLLSSGCDDNPFLLILVHSSPENFAKRSCVRNTWGSNQTNWKVFFVIGRSTSAIQHKIYDEQQEFGDIIQGSFKDSYRNLTLKHITTLKYAIYHCPRVKYVLKTDDDVLVNLLTMKKFLFEELSPYGASDLLFCNVKKSVSVMRTYRSKWRVTFVEYRLREYPPYCPGWAVLYSPDVVFKLYRSAQNSTETFWIDDVFVTGILAAQNNITHTDSLRMIISPEDQVELLDGVYPKETFLFGRPQLKMGEIEKMWKVISSYATKSVANSVFLGRNL